MARRRQVLLGGIALATAGCLNQQQGGDASATSDSSNASTDASSSSSSKPPADLEQTGDGYRVIPGAISDGSLSFTSPASESTGFSSIITTVTFTDPIDATWQIQGSSNGDPIDDSGSDSDSGTTAPGPQFSVERTIDPTDETQHAFIVPVYDGDTDQFSFHVYVDQAYREAHETHTIVWGKPRSNPGNMQSRSADFSEHHDGIYRDTLTYDMSVSAEMQLPTVGLIDQTLSEATPTSEPTYTGVALVPQRKQAEQEPDFPSVAFSFDYDESEQTVTITHDGGDTVDAQNLTVRLDGEPTDTQFSGDVVAGDSITVDTSSAGENGEIRIIWDNPSDNSSTTLAQYPLSGSSQTTATVTESGSGTGTRVE